MVQVVPKAPQHFRSSQKQATCGGCFSRQSICSVISLHSGMYREMTEQIVVSGVWDCVAVSGTVTVLGAGIT